MSNGRSQEAVKKSIRSYGVRVMDPASMPLKKTQATASHESFSRFSEKSIHSTYALGNGAEVSKWLTNIPYATLVATVLCIVGLALFFGTSVRAVTLTSYMFDNLFKMRVEWVETLQFVFTVLAGLTMVSGLIILFLSFLSTGATREQVFKAFNARVGGRISCALFMFASYTLVVFWIVALCILVVAISLITLFWFVCSYTGEQLKNDCIDFTQYHFLFPNVPDIQNKLKICESNDMKLFCKDYVEKAEAMFIVAAVASFMIILSLVHYLMCLASNYVHIRNQAKFQELQDLKYLTEAEALDRSKSRF